MYSTPAANVCYFKEKNDSKLAAYYFEGGGGKKDKTLGKKNNGYDLQAGYAYSNTWAVTAAYSSRTESDSSFGNYDLLENKSTVNYKRTLFEIGMGHFSLNKNKTTTGNIFFGIGFGNYNIQENGVDSADGYSRFHKTAFIKFYIQPSVNIVTARYFHASFGGRLNFMRYGSFSSNYTDGEKAYWDFARLNNKLVIFAEPNINLQLGIPDADWIRFEMNINFMLFNLGFPESTRLTSRKGGISLGLTFNPAMAFKKSK
jgi:hypothetical protein